MHPTFILATIKLSKTEDPVPYVYKRVRNTVLSIIFEDHKILYDGNRKILGICVGEGDY